MPKLLLLHNYFIVFILSDWLLLEGGGGARLIRLIGLLTSDTPEGFEGGAGLARPRGAEFITFVTPDLKGGNGALDMEASAVLSISI